MSDFSCVGGVDHNPQIAINLGHFLVEFATTETTLIVLLSVALCGNSAMANAIFGHIKGIFPRCQILSACAEAAELSEEDKAALADFASRIAEVNGARNKFVHAMYETNFVTKEVRKTTWSFSLTNKSSTEPVTIDKLDSAIQNIRTLSRDIMEHLFLDEMVPLSTDDAEPPH